MVGLHHLRRLVGLPRFFSSSTPYTIAHVQYDLTTSWWRLLYDTVADDFGYGCLDKGKES